MTIEIIIILLLIIANGLFAMSEIAVVSVRKTRLQQLANDGNHRAKSLLDLVNSPSRFLSTVQVGITMVGIMAGAVGGATIARSLSIEIGKMDILAPYAEAIAFTIVVLLITYFTLILGELVPKQIALHSSEKIAMAVSRPMKIISMLTSPAVHMLSVSTEGILKIFGIKTIREQLVSEEEIKVMIDQGIEAGMFEEAERDMIESVFSLGDSRAGALMTPRTDVFWLDVEDTSEEIHKKITESDHSRFPVCQDSLDKVLGIVRAKDILNALKNDEPFNLKKYMHTPLFVPESAPILKVLETFKKMRQHAAIVVDEYGITQGFITVYDILEAIVGDIPSVDETDEPMAVQRKDGSWLLDGLLPIDDFKEIFNIKELPGEGSYQTLGGFIMMQLGQIPSAADFFEWEDLKIEVVDMDGSRVDKVLLIPLKEKAVEIPAQPYNS